MFSLLNPKNDLTTALQLEMLDLLQSLQRALSLSRQVNHQLVLTEVNDCIHEIALVDKNPIGLSLEVGWMVREIDALRYQQLFDFDAYEGQLWKDIKQLNLTYPATLRESLPSEAEELWQENQ